MISQVELANTFDVWRVKTNQLITIANDLKEGNLLSTGTISIDNSGGFEGNVALNVKSGLIRGDAGLLSNVGAPGSIKNDKLENTSVTVTTTQGQIILSTGTLTLGSTVYLNVANLTVNSNDVSVSNIASANVVNAVHRIATVADVRSNLAFANANSAGAMALAAFETANAVNAIMASVNTSISTTLNLVSGINANALAAFEQANTVYAVTNLAYAQANTARDHANAAFADSNTRLSTSGGTITGNLIIAGNFVVSGQTYFSDTTTLNIADPLFILAANNILTDALDIGFAAAYNNGSAVVYTGLVRDSTNKEYYIFEEYSENPAENDIDTVANNFTIAVLNANVKSSNVVVSETLLLSGQNVYPWVTSVGAASNTIAIAAFTKANSVIITNPPPNAVGISTDTIGTVAISNSYLYIATNSHSGAANTWKSIAIRPFEEQTPYLMMPFFYGTPPATAAIFYNVAPYPYYLPANLIGSLVRANTPPSGATSFSLFKNYSTNIGTISFAASNGVASFNVTNTSFTAGDILGIHNASSPDGTISNIMLSILGYRI